MNNKPKLVYGIKGKLVSAACMLLVAVIMVVSSTYAWFTLSTAPEVTGIQTAVGANGSLEMALLPDGVKEDGTVSSIADILKEINSASGDSMEPWKDKNSTWGNLVDLSDADVYGWNNLILYPSELNVTGDNKIDLTGGVLMTPEYGADGRVTDVVANTSLGIYDATEQNFPISGGFGVRAIGVSSGLTDRQLAFRNAVSAANSAQSSAKLKASQSLNKNGAGLANVAMAVATSENPTISRADVVTMMAIVTDLNGEGGVLDLIETAYKQYILAFAASSNVADENVWKTVNSNLGLSLDEMLAQAAALPNGLSAAATALAETRAKVEAAGTALDTLLADAGATTFAWEQVRPALSNLADVSAMTVNDTPASEVKNNMSSLVNSVMSKGLTVAVPTGAGVYADIADHCGNYTASVQVEKVKYGEGDNAPSFGPVTAKMQAKTTAGTPLLTVLSNYMKEQKAPADTTGSLPMSEFYGYIVDMAFRTNAPESNLLLQTTPVDRIYEGNNNADTIGHGSTMTFTTTATGFGTNQVVDLMKNIRIVFFNPVDGTILANARLDIDYTTSKDENGNVIYTPATGSYTVGADGVTANIYLYDETNGTFLYDNAEITALTQNVAQAVSVLVYLDGEGIENADVAANGTASMSGTMNLQFASDAELNAMEYGDLHTPDKNVPAEGN